MKTLIEEQLDELRDSLHSERPDAEWCRDRLIDLTQILHDFVGETNRGLRSANDAINQIDCK
jgi:hypothetical protein